MPNTSNILSQANQNLINAEDMTDIAVLDRALTLWAMNPTADELAPYVTNGKFSINPYMRAVLSEAGVSVDDGGSYKYATVNRALTSWFLSPTPPEFAPFIQNGQFYLGDYLRSVGLVVPGTDRADLTDFELVPPLDNVVINHADFTGSALVVNGNDGQQVNNFSMVDVIVEGASIVGLGVGATLFNCTFTQLQYNVVTWENIQSNACTFSNSIRFSPPTFTTDDDDEAVRAYNMYAKVPPSSSIFSALQSGFNNCVFSDFSLSNMYAGLNYFTNNTYLGEVSKGNVSLSEAAGNLNDPINLLTHAYMWGLIIQEQYPDNMPCQNMSAALVLLDGTRLRGADFTNSTICLSVFQKLNDVDLTGAIFTNATVIFDDQTYQGPAEIQAFFSSIGLKGSIALDEAAVVDAKQSKGKAEQAPIKLSDNPSRLLKSETKDKQEDNEEVLSAQDSKKDNKNDKDEPKREPGSGMGKK